MKRSCSSPAPRLCRVWRSACVRETSESWAEMDRLARGALSLRIAAVPHSECELSRVVRPIHGAHGQPHATPVTVRAGMITADDQADNDWADATCKPVVPEHRAHSAVTRMAHWIARFCFARQRLNVDAVWIPEPTRDYTSARPRLLPLLALPSIQRRGRNLYS